MIKIDIFNSLFHGITDYEIYGVSNQFDCDWNNSLFKLKSILATGYIMTRKSIYEKMKITFETEGANIDSTAVSIAFYPENNELYDTYKKKYYIKRIYSKNHNNYDFLEYAFHTYLRNIVLVLNPRLLNELAVRKIGPEEWTGSMPDEIQIEQDIPVKYIVAVALKEEIYKYEFLIQKIKEILAEFGMNVPIISLQTGCEFDQSNEMTRK